MMRDFGGSMKREDYDGVFKALGDEHRLRILRLLAKKELSAGEILESMDIVQSTLSHHMKVLTDNGVVTATRSGKWTIYSVNRPVLQEAAGRLEAFLSEAEHAEKSDIAIRARATVAEEKVQEEKKKSLISEEGRETDHGKPEIRIEEQAGGAHELPAPAAESSAGTVEQAAGGHERPASAVEPVAGMREQTAGVHEPSGKKKGKKGKKSKKGGKK
jgi:ArsR family transcriptional regulator